MKNLQRLSLESVKTLIQEARSGLSDLAEKESKTNLPQLGTLYRFDEDGYKIYQKLQRAVDLLDAVIEYK